MQLSTSIIRKIRQVIRYFETSKLTGADYGAISVYHDGPGKKRQLTFGAMQTTEYGNLKALVQMYADAKGRYAAELAPFVPLIGDRNRATLADNPRFMTLIRFAANDPIMHQVQDRFFDDYYFNPARSWAEENGFTLPLSMLVIFDSFVHSGSILRFLRQQFPAKTPAAGGKEKEWITQYVITRDAWLENHANHLLQRTDYRTDSFIYAIRQDNWELSKPFAIVNYKDKDENGKPVVEAEIG